MPLRLAFHIAIRHLFARKRQTILSMLGIVIGGGIFALMVAITAGQTDFLRSRLIDVSPHINVKSERVEPITARNILPDTGGAIELISNLPPSVRRELKPYTELLEKAEKSSPLVLAVAPYVAAQGVFRNGTRYQTVNVRGIEPEREKYIGRLKADIKQGRLEALRSDPDGAVIGSGLARKLNVGVGGNFTYITSTGAIQRLRVVAIFESGIASFDDRRGLINLALAQTLGHMPRNAVSGLSVQVRDLDRIDEAKYAVQTATGYRAESWEESNAQILDFQGRQQITTRILVIFVFITALFGIANTLVAIVLQKRLDIAVMKSFGVTRGGVVAVFLLEGLIIGLVGGALAATLGYILAGIFGQLQLFPQDNPRAYLRFERFPVSLNLSIYLATFGLSLLMAIVASILPARRAAKLIPVETIRKG